LPVYIDLKVENRVRG